MEAVQPEPFIVENFDNVLHLTYGSEDDFNHIYSEIAIPENIKVYISDLSCKKLITHSNLTVLDLDPIVNTDLEITSLYNIKDIVIRDTNLINISLLELFPKNCRYRYSHCSLNGIPISKLVNELYKKYFDVYPKYETVYGVFPQIQNNIVYYRIHSDIIEQIKSYEENISRAKKFSNIIKEELVMKACHPKRLERWIIYMDLDLDYVLENW